MTLPEAVGLELGRLVDRWRVLPLGQASAVMPGVRAVLVDLEAETATAAGREPVEVPDLGPGAAMDQLTVLLQDRFAEKPAADGARGIGGSGTPGPPRDAGESAGDGDGVCAWASRLADLRAQTWG